MNEVRLTYNPYQKKSKILIDNGNVSPYSEISNYLLEPFNLWCMKIIDSLSRELNDDFSLVFTSGTIETMIMHYISKNKQDVCANFVAQKFENNSTPSERAKMLLDIFSNNGQSFRKVDHTIKIYLENERLSEEFSLLLQNNRDLTHSESYHSTFLYNNISICDIRIETDIGISVSDGLDVGIFVFSSESSAQAFCDSNPQLPPKSVFIIVGADFCVLDVNKNKYVFSVSLDKFADMLTDLIDFLIVTPAIYDAVNSKALSVQNANRKDGIDCEIVTAVEPIVFADCHDVIETGESIIVQISTFPEMVDRPNITVKSSNEKIVRSMGNTIFGVDSGEAFIEVFNVGNVIPILRKKLTVIQRTRIERIELSDNNFDMEFASSCRIMATVFPSQADNLSELKWETSNPKVAIVDDNGCITACGVGNCEISLSAGEVVAKCAVCVKAMVDYVELPQLYGNELQSTIKQKIPYQAVVMPENAFDRTITYNVVQNNECIEYDGQYIYTVGIGCAKINFYSSDEMKCAQCHIEVISTLYQKPNPFKILAVIAAIAGAAISMLQPFGIIAALLSIIFGVLTVAKDTKNDNEAKKIIGNTKGVSKTFGYFSLLMGIASTIFNIYSLFC